MDNIQVAQSEFFGEVKCDFWEDERGNILMTRKQIGEALEYSDPITAITKLHSRHKNRLDKHSVPTKLVGTDNKMYDTYLYNSKGVMEVCRWSKQPKANAFMDWAWEVIEKIRQKGYYIHENISEKSLMKLKIDLTAAQFASEMLKLNSGSKILMLETVYKNHKIATNSLPAYTEERITKSLTALLKENGIASNARMVNKLLQMEGYQDQKTRPSSKSKDKIKKFWSLTTKGLKYGKNLINSHNQKETQPHFYIDTFSELMRKIEVL